MANSIYTHKIVNGERVDLTLDEIAEFESKEADYVPYTPTLIPTKEQLLLEVQTLTAKINALSEPVSLLDKVSSLLGVK
jgi:hypothetical protein